MRDSALDVSPRIFAIDWSGALKGSRKKIWVAEISRGILLRLESGRDRRETIDYVIESCKNTPEIVVGLDFAFSCPEWFVESKGRNSIYEFWGLAEEQGERWMREWPFWSKGKPERQPDGEYRCCEETPHLKPSSVFKLVGAAQVGRGSIRGMPYLFQLRKNGFSVWRFDSPGWPRVIEIYPRLFTRGIVKSDSNARCAFVEKYRKQCSTEALGQAANCDDAFDALVSAFAMSEHLEQLCSLTQSVTPRTLIEGTIWVPGSSA
jgi:hypothetical protein